MWSPLSRFKTWPLIQRKTPYPFSSFSLFSPPRHSSTGNHQRTFCIDLYILDTSYKWNHALYDFCVWFLSFGKVFSRFHQPCNLYEYSILFNGSVIFCCMYIPLFIYPFISWWAFGLFLPFGCCEQCSCEQCVYTYILVWIPVFSSLVTSYKLHCGVIW